MKKNYHTVEPDPKSIRTIIERCKIDTHNTEEHDSSLSWLATDTSRKSDGVKLVWWTHTSPLSKMMRSCKCFSHVSKMPNLTYNRVNRVFKKTMYSLSLCWLAFFQIMLSMLPLRFVRSVWHVWGYHTLLLYAWWYRLCNFCGVYIDSQDCYL